VVWVLVACAATFGGHDRKRCLLHVVGAVVVGTEVGSFVALRFRKLAWSKDDSYVWVRHFAHPGTMSFIDKGAGGVGAMVTRRVVVGSAVCSLLAHCAPVPSSVPGPTNPSRPAPGSPDLPFQPGVALLTFDDGPHPSITPSVLSDLRRLDRKAVFFMVGSMVESHPEVARAVVDAGHDVGNHSFSHPILAGRSEAFVQDEIVRTQNAILSATGVRPVWFRPPYGSYDAQTLAVAADHGLRLVMWDVDTQDYRQPGAATIASVIRSAPAGAVVLIHDIQPQTAAALRLV
jgi:hypothetical protein